MRKNDIVYFVCCINEKEYTRKLIVVSTTKNKVITNKGTFDKSKVSLMIPEVDGYELPIIE